MFKVEINYKIRTPQKYEALFEVIVKKTAKHLKLKSLDVSVAFIGPMEMKKLNKRYRGLDKITDVLSFEEVSEVVICLAQAKKQAKSQKKSIKEEVAFLFLHGLLHILGFDHKNKLQKIKMEKSAEKILKN